MNDSILFTQEKHIGLITLNRPTALNALTLPMILALQEQLSAWEQDNSIHAVVIKAEEGKAFCAGGDVRWLYEAGKSNDPQQMQFFLHEYRLNHYINQYKKPYIALMNGITMGGGVGISLHGSHPVASENFLFAMPETGIGFFPDIGASHLLSRCPYEFGTYLALTGHRLQAEEAYHVGLVKYLVTANEMNTLLAALINTDLSQNPAQEVDACIKRFAFSITSQVPQDATKIASIFNKSTMEEILAQLDANEHNFFQTTKDILNQKAPLSLKVTLRQIKQAKHLSMGECVKMDYCLVSHFMTASDFYEGVRALLIDKDKNPQWSPQTLSEVTNDQVEAYFTCKDRPLLLT
ncbi:enoyl-CoA hydratase/carnithine racemase (plasmid) [Legionella adelaidensis]|uniref:3-hydroxyisobutyryl-CoA hydrolase n=1 Tax=Legionella adelaidensis TaxID=45056 RepID=A0A0W0R4C2_9GAMM|nr:enoyl-CoA hydratase/isomerase family protein [Legionella adelaidensis]KTC65899.1 Enoyl-CoA hydratase/carnithine racemase [Legionella adelaidensis]VEH85519.1 enoyl-CoA hydratase/carnithine racemase [Legionella adelaidensis]